VVAFHNVLYVVHALEVFVRNDRIVVIQTESLIVYLYQEKLEDAKEVIRSRKLKKDRHYKCRKKKRQKDKHNDP
jgi:hypothetical protein